MSTNGDPSLHVTLEHPEYAPDDAGGATFERYANALSARHVTWLAALFALSNLLFWPTDWLFIERGSHLAYSFVPMRIGFIGIALTMAFALWRSRRVRRHVALVLVGGIAAGYVVTALTVVQSWSPAESTTLAWLHTGYLMPLLTMAIVVPLRQRIAATFALPILEIGVFYLISPDLVVAELIGIPLVVWAFACTVSVAVGEVLYRLLRINFDQRRSLAERADELEKRRDSLQSMVDWLQGLNQTLSHEVQNKAGDLSRILDRVDRAREQERRQISSELDDELARRILDLRSEVISFRHRFQSSQDIVQALAKLDYSISGALEKVNVLVEELQPERVAQKGIVRAVTELVDSARKRCSSNIRLSIVPKSFEVPEKESTTFYRILKEVLNNAVQHAEARDISVTLSYTPGQLAFRVADNGSGLSPEDRRLGGRGLKVIQEQAESLRGELSIESGPDQGTTVDLQAPVIATLQPRGAPESTPHKD